MSDYLSHLVPSARRQNIVERNSKSESSVYAARIKDEGELAYALRFLTDHFTYKRSKAVGKVPASAIEQVRVALADVVRSYGEEIATTHGARFDMTVEEPTSDARPVSGLGADTIQNPWSYR